VNETHPDPERLALAALPAEPDDPTVSAHLNSCVRCRDEVADLRRTVELARDGLGDLPAPPDRVWQGIAAELGLPGGPNTNGKVDGVGVLGALTSDRPGPDASGPAAAPAEPSAGRSPRRGLRRVLLPAAAAVVGLVVGLGIGRALMPEPPPPEPVAQLAPVGDLDPGATGTVAMTTAGAERQMVVQVQGVTNISGGDHLEAWLMDASGRRLVPLGPLDGGNGDFHGTFAVPEGLPLAQFGRVDVSAERWDGNPGHSTISVLRGAVS
jgi:hypothetical protein